MRSSLYFLLLSLFLTISILQVVEYEHNEQYFDGQLAYRHVLAQVTFGPRIPGSVSRAQTQNYIIAELSRAQWQVSIQLSSINGFPIYNITASRGSPLNIPEIIIGAHYDSRLLADQDYDFCITQGVPGANDGASGVAILLELARSLPKNAVPVWLVFFDAEDNGGIEGRDWIMGSRAFANALEHRPQSVVIIDMVGDVELDIFFERNSNIELAKDIWDCAASLGFTQFHQEYKYSMLDDHIPFVEAGIKATNIIDFDYPFWHTHMDTPDKVSPESLAVVGKTLLKWIMSYNNR